MPSWQGHVSTQRVPSQAHSSLRSTHSWGVDETRHSGVAGDYRQVPDPHRKPPSQTWHTFLNKRMKDRVSANFFVVPTASFQALFVLVILSHDQRLSVHFSAIANPTTEWTGRQLLGAFPGTAFRAICQLPHAFLLASRVASTAPAASS